MPTEYPEPIAISPEFVLTRKLPVYWLILSPIAIAFAPIAIDLFPATNDSLPITIAPSDSRLIPKLTEATFVPIAI